MPRVHHRKARKDYPDNGIVKGDMYYTCRRKTGPWSSVTLRSLTPFKASQLTGSAFKSAWFGAEEGWDASGKSEQDITDVAEAIRAAGEEAGESLDNMPESLQQGDTGQMLEERASQCEDTAGDLDSLASEYEELEEPVEPLGDLEEDWENESAAEDYETEMDTFKSEVERIRGDVGDIFGNMPE